MLGSALPVGPASTNPKTWLYYLDFPKETVRDTVRAFDRLRQHLGIERIDILIGTSMGGFMSFEWVDMCPWSVGKQILYRHRRGRATLARRIQRRQPPRPSADPTFKEHRDLKGGMEGLEAARAIALLTYRCEEGLFKQNEDSDDTVFAGKVGCLTIATRPPSSSRTGRLFLSMSVTR